jgi:hypothetical protein
MARVKRGLKLINDNTKFQSYGGMIVGRVHKRLGIQAF